jgi:hypothetical protein
MMADTYKLHFLKEKAAKEAKESKESKTMEAKMTEPGETQELVDLRAQVAELQKKLADKTSDFEEVKAVSTHKTRVIKNAEERNEALETRNKGLERRNETLEDQLVNLETAAADHCEQHCRDYDELHHAFHALQDAKESEAASLKDRLKALARDAIDEGVYLRGKITRQAREIKNLLAKQKKQKKHQPKHQPKHQKWTRQAKHQPKHQPKHPQWTRQPKDQVTWTVVSSETSELMRKFPEFPRELFEMLP